MKKCKNCQSEYDKGVLQGKEIAEAQLHDKGKISYLEGVEDERKRWCMIVPKMLRNSQYKVVSEDIDFPNNKFI